jgi:hypothetical protein
MDQLSYPFILTTLEDEIKRRRAFTARNEALIIGISRQVRELEDEVAAYREKAQRSYPTFFGSLLALFLASDDFCDRTLQARRMDILKDPKVFQEFFAAALAKLKAFVAPIADHAFAQVATHLHTWAMQSLPLAEYVGVHPEFTAADEMLSIVRKEDIVRLCVNPAAPKLRGLMDPQLFQFAVVELRKAEELEFPIEAIRCITSALDLIAKVFELSDGSRPQADEMTPLFRFSLLSSGLSKMDSLQQYLNHFLSGLPQGDVKLLDDFESIALTHYSNHVDLLSQIIN